MQSTNAGYSLIDDSARICTEQQIALRIEGTVGTENEGIDRL